MYKPEAKRRWGFFALPILHGDRLVGKLDATADRKASKLVVRAVHQDVPFTREITAGVDAEIAELASWLGLGRRLRENASRRTGLTSASTSPAGRGSVPRISSLPALVLAPQGCSLGRGGQLLDRPCCS